MPSNNSKYSQDMREQTVKYIFENNKSATQVAEEIGIDINTVCRWVRDYRRAHNMPTYAESKGMKRAEPKSQNDLLFRVKELERDAKKREKDLQDEKDKVIILKKSLHIFMQPQG
jgi:transposase-like protein